MANWYDCRVLKAGANGTGDGLYVWLKSNDGTIDGYYQLGPNRENQILATALQALSIDYYVDAFLGDAVGDAKNPDYFYCTALYVRRP